MAIPKSIPRAALVAGGSHPIGRAIALALAGAGFAVLPTDPTPADLANVDAIENLIPAASSALSPIGVLVNNASILGRDQWSNSRVPFLLMQRFASALPATAEGAVINLLDQRIVSPTRHFVDDMVSRAALCALTQSMALALAPRIRVNAIAPDTTPDEVAQAVLALLALPSVTGQILVLDGGRHLQWTPARAPANKE